MKIQLIKSPIEKIMQPNRYKVDKLCHEGMELDEALNDYLTRFTVGILDPDVAGKKPDGFISNLKKGRFGEFSSRYIITAFDGNNVIGILIGMPEGDQLHIYSLHILPEYRGKGVGSELLSRSINDMCDEGYEKILLDVHTDNIPAYNLYKKFGFKDIEAV